MLLKAGATLRRSVQESLIAAVFFLRCSSELLPDGLQPARPQGASPSIVFTVQCNETD